MSNIKNSLHTYIWYIICQNWFSEQKRTKNKYWRKVLKIDGYISDPNEIEKCLFALLRSWLWLPYLSIIFIHGGISEFKKLVSNVKINMIFPDFGPMYQSLMEQTALIHSVHSAQRLWEGFRDMYDLYLTEYFKILKIVVVLVIFKAKTMFWYLRKWDFFTRCIFSWGVLFCKTTVVFFALCLDNNKLTPIKKCKNTHWLLKTVDCPWLGTNVMSN